jgi:hypothetical protein
MNQYGLKLEWPSKFWWLTQTKVYSGSVWMKIGVAQQLLVEVSHTEF